MQHNQTADDTLIASRKSNTNVINASRWIFFLIPFVFSITYPSLVYALHYKVKFPRMMSRKEADEMRRHYHRCHCPQRCRENIGWSNTGEVKVKVEGGKGTCHKKSREGWIVFTKQNNNWGGSLSVFKEKCLVSTRSAITTSWDSYSHTQIQTYTYAYIHTKSTPFKQICSLITDAIRSQVRAHRYIVSLLRYLLTYLLGQFVHYLLIQFA